MNIIKAVHRFLLYPVLVKLNEMEVNILKEIDDLNSAVTNMQNAVNGAVADIQKLASEITANSTDPAAVEAAAQKINDMATALNSAVNPAQ